MRALKLPKEANYQNPQMQSSPSILNGAKAGAIGGASVLGLAGAVLGYKRGGIKRMFHAGTNNATNGAIVGGFGGAVGANHS